MNLRTLRTRSLVIIVIAVSVALAFVVEFSHLRGQTSVSGTYSDSVVLQNAIHRAEHAEAALEELRNHRLHEASAGTSGAFRKFSSQTNNLSSVKSYHRVLVEGGFTKGWMRPSIEDNAPPQEEIQTWDISTEQGRKTRRECVQRHLRGAFGLDTLKEYFVQGCNYPALYDFDAWAAATGCGTEPIEGDLLIHTAWTGGYKHVQEDLEALLDSFLMTQDQHHSKFVFWLIDTKPDLNDDFQRKYRERGRGSIEFKEARLNEFAKGTAMDGVSDFLEVNWTAVKKGPRWKANMFRILILHREGGIWVDTDTLFLRNMRPLLEFAGEFASKLTMSLYYNNNVLGLRKGSSLGASLINDMVATPDAPFSTKKYCKYVGNPCYPKWTWNHGLIQLAVRHNRGIVIFPTGYTDPAYACYPQWLLAKSGGQVMRDFTIEEILEFIRGSFTLHTRAYNAEKPINPRSNYGRLYSIASNGASIVEAAPIVKVVPRSAGEVEQLDQLFRRRGEPDKIVDPAFIPRGRRINVLLRSEASVDTCVNAARYVKGEMYGGMPELQATASCSITKKSFNETVVFLWHPETGHIRPAHREPGYILCVDAFPLNIQRPKNATWATKPKLIVCNPKRPSQQWEYDEKFRFLRVNYLDLCMEISNGGQLGLRPCSVRIVGQRFVLDSFEGVMPW